MRHNGATRTFRSTSKGTSIPPSSVRDSAASAGARRREPVKARHARSVALEFLEQTWHPFIEIAGVETRGVGGWTLDDVRKADPKARKLGIVLGTESVGTERSLHALAQLRRGVRGPETVRQTSEVVSSLNRVQPGIDSDEDKVEAWLEIIGQGRERIFFNRTIDAVPC
jgi:hypothetical protein